MLDSGMHLDHETAFGPPKNHTFKKTGTFGGGGGGDQGLAKCAEVSKENAIDAARLRELLTEVDLEYLIEREGGIDQVVDWGSQLSLGEQQRLGMARLFYHTPKFAILDECTSGVTVSLSLWSLRSDKLFIPISIVIVMTSLWFGKIGSAHFNNVPHCLSAILTQNLYRIEAPLPPLVL